MMGISIILLTEQFRKKSFGELSHLAKAASNSPKNSFGQLVMRNGKSQSSSGLRKSSDKNFG